MNPRTSPPQAFHARTASHTHARKALPAHARPSRPVPLNKKTPAGSSTAPKVGSGGTKHATKEREEEEDDVMAASFLQYCCRRKDKNRPITVLPLASTQSPPQSPFQYGSHETFPFPEIVPQTSPTVARPLSASFPQISEDANASNETYSYACRESEAARYLRQFQSLDLTPALASRQRPQYPRAHTSMTMSSMPSLSNTPTSSPSTSFTHNSFSRPLPPRTNPYSASFGARGTTDLVVPYVVDPSTAPSSLARNTSYMNTSNTLATLRVAESNMTYEKKLALSGASPRQGSLKELFCFAETQTSRRPAPKPTENMESLRPRDGSDATPRQ
ncbi:hypothetical protein LTR66_002517 [Elasticomyces elasticus]|nr:hypothetical protein LTR66_002517 [Elasticomyces elasticus]